MFSAEDFYAMKHNRKPISMVTVYDVAFARMAEAAGIEMLLVGDSAANVMLGLEKTAEITMDVMCVLTAAVKRGAPNSYIVADMPFGSDSEPELACKNAERLLNAGACSVKIEGLPLASLNALKNKGIDIVGHLGLLPQTAKKFTQCGKTEEEAANILREAAELDKLKPCAIVIEHIPEHLGEQVTKKTNAPVIGIGAGKKTDGQVLVMHDILRLHPFKLPPFATNFANLWDAGINGFKKYKEWVNK